MTPTEIEAVAAIGLFAALADGSPSEAERNKLKEIFEGLGGGSLAAVYQRVIFKTTDLATEAGKLGSPELRELAYEMAVGVCGADGSTVPAEQAFLDNLRASLGLAPAATAAIEAQAAGLAAGPVVTPAVMPTPAIDAEIDASIMRYAVLNGALELLPQSLAGMAVVPLQMKMVYEIGKRYGFALDQGHVKEFLATLGAGAAAQVLEGYARRLLGGFLQRTIGRTAARLGDAALGPALTFAGTWAIGMVAKSYYSGGRRLDVAEIRALFARKVAEGRALFPTREAEIREAARKVDVSDLARLVRG